MNPLSRCIVTLVCGMFLLCVGQSPADDADLDTVVDLFELLLDVDEETAADCLSKIVSKVSSGELPADRSARLKERLLPKLQPLVQRSPTSSLVRNATGLAALWRDERALQALRKTARTSDAESPSRHHAIEILIAAQDESFVTSLADLLTNADATSAGHLLLALGNSRSPQVAPIVLKALPSLPADIQPKAIELLIRREEWSVPLVTAVERAEVSASFVNANQIRALASTKNPELARRVKALWGEVRQERNPQREQVIHEVRTMLFKIRGDALRGQVIFQKVCGQCHKIHGEGQEVGPDLTSNGRSTFDQLLANVLDPSLVIGPSYQAMTVVTSDGRVLTGLTVENNEQRVVLKVQGGKQEIIPIDDVEELAQSKLSLMPEGLEKQLPEQELADLFSFLLLDKPPRDPTSRPISGSPIFE